MSSENPPTQAGRSASEIARRHHRQMLLIAAAIVVLSFLLDVRSDQRVTPRELPDFPIPETCGSRALFDVKCPGCGLTRSFIHLARGDWRASLAIHRLGWLLALAVLIQFPYRLFSLKRVEAAAAMRTVARWFGYFLIAMLVGNWVLDVVVFGL